MEEQQPPRRVTPQNELDLQMLTINSVWGQPEINDDLKERLNQYVTTGEVDQEGKEKITVSSLWGLLGFYTRDMRLANLNFMERDYCQFYIDLAGDMLESNMFSPFIICLSRVATVLELSQSKGGFLRKQMNTFTQKSIESKEDVPKKSLFGMVKGKDQQGGY